MTQYLHVYAAVLAAFLVMALGGCDPAQPRETPGLNRVDVEEFARLVDQGDCVLLDVRTPKEFASGHIPGARNLDIHSPGFESEISRLDTESGYLVYCGSGYRSLRACKLMRDAGFHRLYELAPGFNGWHASDRPVER